MTQPDLRPLGRFLVVGLTTVAVDAVAYAVLLWAGVDVDLGKGLAFAIGAVFAYVANWRFTFGARRGPWSEVAFVVVYALALLLNVAVNATVRSLVGETLLGATLAFLVATAASAAWNFAGMSLFVFQREERRAEHAQR